MRISDWSSDVCSSDLDGAGLAHCGKAATEAEGDAFNLRPVPVGHGTEFRIAVLAFLGPGARGRGDAALQDIAVGDVQMQVAQAPAGPRVAERVTGARRLKADPAFDDGDRKSTRLNSRL